MTPFVEYDPANRRTVAMWDECGMRFRLNTVEPGGQIELHKHSYTHVAAVWGEFELTTKSPEGEVVMSTVCTGTVTIPANYEHLFKGQGTVLCFWPIGHDGAD